MDWSPVFSGIVGGLAAGGFVYFLRRRANAPARGGDDGASVVLSHSWFIKGFAIGFLALGVLLLYGAFHSAPSDTTIAFVVAGSMFVLSVLFTAEAFLFLIEIRDDGLRVRTMLGRTKRIRVDEMRAVRHIAWLDVYVLSTHGRGGVWFSNLLPGLVTLFRQFREWGVPAPARV
jgi:hypothetical protein